MRYGLALPNFTSRRRPKPSRPPPRPPSASASIRLDDRPRPRAACRRRRLSAELRRDRDARLGRRPASRRSRLGTSVIVVPHAERGHPGQGPRHARRAERRTGDRRGRDRLERDRVREPRRGRPVPRPRRVSRRDVSLWRHLWSGSSEPFEGRFHTIDDFVFGPLPRSALAADLDRRPGGAGTRAGRPPRRRLSIVTPPPRRHSRSAFPGSAPPPAPRGRPMPTLSARVRV